MEAGLESPCGQHGCETSQGGISGGLACSAPGQIVFQAWVVLALQPITDRVGLKHNNADTNFDNVCSITASGKTTFQPNPGLDPRQCQNPSAISPQYFGASHLRIPISILQLEREIQRTCGSAFTSTLPYNKPIHSFVSESF